MRRLLLILALSVGFVPVGGKPSRAYDMDCAILLCMAGGFPPSAVCAAAYAEMIRRITPWPVRPPFGICTFAAVPIALGGPGGRGEVDISLPEYAWLRRTRVLWFSGRSYEPRDEPLQWDWSVRSCNHENRFCRYIISNLPPQMRAQHQSHRCAGVAKNSKIARRSVMLIPLYLTSKARIAWVGQAGLNPQRRRFPYER